MADRGTGRTSVGRAGRGATAPRRLSGRGLTYWDDGADGVVFYVTPGYRLIALNALTGREITDFGDDGIVDLKLGLDQDIDPWCSAVSRSAGARS